MPGGIQSLMLIGMVRTFLITLVLALLPQNPASTTPLTPDNQNPPTAEQGRKPGTKDDLATILQSGSTNTRGYKVVIHHDGSAMVEISGGATIQRSEPAQSQPFPPGTIDTKKLRRLLREIGDVSKIPSGPCAKSVSFGTRTQIEYAGKTSGDLQCVRQQPEEGDQAPLQPSKDLSRFVQATLGQLRINTRRIGPNR